MNSKILMSIVFLIHIFLFAILSLKSNENTINNPLNTKIIDSNVRVFFNRVIHEYFDDNSFSAMNLLTGVVVPETDGNKDIQMRDSASMRYNFYLRSGDLALRIPGYETRFGQFIAYDNISESEFDTLSKITNLGSTLEPSDFFRISTAEYTNPTYFNAPLTQNTVYSFYLKGKSPVTPIYGMLRLRSAFIQGNEFNLAVDVKINTAGENQFRRNIINIKKISTTIPSKFKLYNNYPNPFNPITTIKFSLPKAGIVTLKVIDITGREVATLINGLEFIPGVISTKFDGSKLASGVYFYTLFYNNNVVDTKKMLLIK